MPRLTESDIANVVGIARHGASETIHEAIERSGFALARPYLTEPVLSDWLAAHPEALDDWDRYASTTPGARWQLNAVRTQWISAGTAFSDRAEAVSHYILKELDFWAGIGSIESFNDRVDQFLRLSYPCWSDDVLTSAVQDDGSVTFTVISEHAPDDRRLYITTTEWEITVYFEGWHGHYDFDVDDGAACFGADCVDVARMIDAILDETTCSVYFTRDGKWCGSCNMGPGDRDWALLVRGETTLGFDDADAVRVRSWKGTHDLERPIIGGGPPGAGSGSSGAG